MYGLFAMLLNSIIQFSNNITKYSCVVLKLQIKHRFLQNSFTVINFKPKTIVNFWQLYAHMPPVRFEYVCELLNKYRITLRNFNTRDFWQVYPQFDANRQFDLIDVLTVFSKNTWNFTVHEHMNHHVYWFCRRTSEAVCGG